MAAMQFLVVLGWGPAAIPGWAVAFIVSAGQLVVWLAASTTAATKRAKSPSSNRHTRIFSNMALFTVAMGYGRAAHIQRDNFWPLRYSCCLR